MISVEIASAIFVLSLTLCLVPCAELVVIISRSIIQGPLSGFALTLGMCSGSLAQVIAMAFGLSVLVQQSTAAFFALKIVGTAYLIYLAWQAFSLPIDMTRVPKKNRTIPGHYSQGLLMNLSNPINPLFLLVFLPPFVEEGRGSVFLQLLQLGTLFTLAVFLGYCAISIAASAAGKQFLSKYWLRRSLQLGSGTIISGFAIYLALAKPLLP